jgi:putative membrane protein
MKSNSLSLVTLLAATLLWSCGSNTESSTTTDSTAVSTTTTTMDTGMSTTATTTQPASTAPLDKMDKDFVMKAAAGSMMEVELGKAAQQNAENQRVKDFGAMMERDHSKAADELKTMASNRSMMMNADSLMNLHKGHIDMMKKKTGKDFDKAYMSMMLDDHQKDVKEFEKASKMCKDEECKSFAAKSLPVLQTHLDSAKAISKVIK